MQIFSFKKGNGKEINQCNSTFVMSRILLADTNLLISCMYIEPHGMIEYHEATVPQLMLVMSGEAVVKGGHGDGSKVESGLAVFWEEGEGHETFSECGTTAIVIEGKELNPAIYMKAVAEKIEGV